MNSLGLEVYFRGKVCASHVETLGIIPSTRGGRKEGKKGRRKMNFLLA
jgi:hypothetical protein